MSRFLTISEIRLLRPVFSNTLNYHKIRIGINKVNFGGRGNSVTPAGLPYMSRDHYCDDFAASSVNDDDQWTFVHEIAHVWQWQHGEFPTDRAIGLYICKRGKYENAYPYALAPGKDLLEYNLEQQASIIADYWALTKGLKPQDNKDRWNARLKDYADVIPRVNRSGPPSSRMYLPMDQAPGDAFPL